jgi:hypothetical protein
MARELEELLAEREVLKNRREELLAALKTLDENQKKLLAMKLQLEAEVKGTNERLVALHQEIVQVCNAEVRQMKEEVGRSEALPREVSDLIPSKEEFERLVNAKAPMRPEVQEAIQNNFVDKTLNEIISIDEWGDREGKMRGAGWRAVPAATDLAPQDRVAVAQVSRDGQKVSIVEGYVSGVELDGGVLINVGGNVVEVDTKGTASKIYRLESTTAALKSL